MDKRYEAILIGDGMLLIAYDEATMINQLLRVRRTQYDRIIPIYPAVLRKDRGISFKQMVVQGASYIGHKIPV